MPCVAWILCLLLSLKIKINERLRNSKELNFLDLNQFEIKKNFFHDGVHFSLLGMKEIAEIVAEYIILNKTKWGN